VIVLGCDVPQGVALLDCSGARPYVLDLATVDDDLAGVLDVRFFGRHTIDVIGIETPTQIFEHGRARLSKGARIGIERALLAATPMVGIVRAVARLRAPDAVIHEGQAHEVRKVLGRLPKDDIDGAIRRALPMLVNGLPARTNSHVRDAIVVALWAWRRASMPAPLAKTHARRSA